MANNDESYKKAAEKLREIEKLWSEMNEELEKTGKSITPSQLELRDISNEFRLDWCRPRCFNWDYMQFILEGGDPKEWPGDDEQESK